MKRRLLVLVLSMIASIHAVQAAKITSHQSTKQSALKQTDERIDLNKADVETLTGSFKGIGKKRAQAIIDYRDANHGFKSIEDLAKVKGFGTSFMERNSQALKLKFKV